MNSAIVIEPTQNLVGTIVSLIKRDKPDWSDVAIVFPGKRPAHFVRKVLGEQCGQSFVPPRLFSIDEFVDFLYRQTTSTPGRDLETIDAVALLFQVHLEIEHRLGESNFNSLDAFLPIGQTLFGELEELRIANMSTDRVIETISAISYGRLNSLPEYYAKFYDRVAKEGYATRSVRYGEVALHAEKIDLSEFSKVIIAGFLALTKSEQQIFSELRRRENTTFVYQRGNGLREHFERLKIGETIDESVTESQPAISLCEAQDTHGQVFALSALLDENIRRGTAVREKTVIVLPTSDALFPLYHHALPLLKPEEYNIALGYPLARTPIYGFVNNLMDLVSAQQGDRFPASAYLKFVLHPYTKNIRLNNRSEITRILFHTLEEVLASDSSKMFVTLEELESMDDVFTRIPFALDDDSVTPEHLKSHLKLVHDRTIRKFSSFRSIGDFARKATEVLLFVYDQSTANLHPLFRAYAETILEGFHEIELSRLSGERFDRVEGYFNFVKQYVAMNEVPFAGTPLRGLQVLGLLETRNLQFDDVYVLDVNDDVIPGGIGREMLLPQRLREKLGLETYRDRERLTEYYFGLLVNGAKRVHLFFTETGKSEKSRFIEKIVWQKQKQARSRDAHMLTNVIRYRVDLSHKPPGPRAKTPQTVTFLKNHAFSASALDTYLRCQLKFYYAYVLGLEEKQDADLDIDNKDIGLFVHAVLKNYFEQSVGKQLTNEQIDRGSMEKLIDELFVQHFGGDAVGTLYLLKRQIIRQLQSFLVNYQQRVLEENTVVIEHLEHNVQIQKFGFRLEGRLDRIERRGNDVFILDYKTGKDDKNAKINFKKLDVGNRSTWGDAVSSLQLPFYLLLYSEKNAGDAKNIRPAFLFLGRNTMDEGIEAEFDDNPVSRAEKFNAAQAVIEGLLKEIVDENTPFVPAQDLQKNCPSCSFSSLCGTQWIKGWSE